ncbi:hypothetical protein F5051DRAFT_456842 [Lentinula edodes]|nr:hypothetical protein F5051DRAFT_456842 [Lentinula edodes]
MSFPPIRFLSFPPQKSPVETPHSFSITSLQLISWVLTKLGYPIDKPWSNALDRARAAVSAHEVSEQELAKSGEYGIVLLDATLSVSTSLWDQTRSVVGGGYANAYARNDWVLRYLFRASRAATGNVNTVASLRPIEGVQGLGNVDVTDKEPDFEGDRVVLPSPSTSPSSHPSTTTSSTNPSTSTNPDTDSNLSWFARRKAKTAAQKEREQRRKEVEQRRSVAVVQQPPSYASWVGKEGKEKAKVSLDEELPPREGTPHRKGKILQLRLQPSLVVGIPLIRVIPHPHPYPLQAQTQTPPGWEFGPKSPSSPSSVSLPLSPTPPTPPSKSPNAGYFSFPPTISMVSTASPYNNNNLCYNPFAIPTATTPTASTSTGFAATPTTSTSTLTLPDFGATTTTTGITFGSADGSWITASADIGLPDLWSDPLSSSRRGEDVGNPWG